MKFMGWSPRAYAQADYRWNSVIAEMIAARAGQPRDPFDDL